MRRSLRKIGKGTGVAIPKSMLRKLGLSEGDKIEIAVDGSAIVLVPEGRHPREGWAEAAKAIGLSGEGCVWDNPDEDWVW
jgi:antitoxin MazE